MPSQDHDDYLKAVFGVDAAAARTGSGSTSTGAPAAAPPPPAADTPWHFNAVRPSLDLSRKAQLDMGETVPRATVEQMLTDFLTKLQSAQKLEAGVRVTDRVRKAGEALTEGIQDARSKIAALLGDGQTLRKPSELAHAIAQCLPDQIPAANYGSLVDMSPKDFPETKPQSASDALAQVLDKTVDRIVSLAPSALRATLKAAVADALASGITAALDQAMSQSSLDDKTRSAIHSAVEAALKQKDGGPPMDRAQDGAGSPDAPPTPPASGPPPQAAPQPPSVPGETILTTPPINTPDTPPKRIEPQASP